MAEIIMIVTAVCRNPNCNQNGVAHVYERESEIDFVVYCGPCQNQIEDVTTTPKE